MANFGYDMTSATSSNNGDGPRYSVGVMSQAGALTDIRMRMSGFSGGATFRLAVYQGGASGSDPTGATLVYDSGEFSYNTNPPLVLKSLVTDFGKTVTGALAAVRTWFVWKTANGAIGLSNDAVKDLSPGSGKEGAIVSATSTAFPSTYPTNSVLSGAEAMMMDLVYTPSASGIAPRAQAAYRRRRM